MKLTFNTRYEQLEYEIDSLVKTSGDPQFTGYLKGLIYDARNNPADVPEIRKALISNYDMYASRMAQMGMPVEPLFFRAVYGNMEAPEILEDNAQESSFKASENSAEVNASSDQVRDTAPEAASQYATAQSFIPNDVPQYNASQGYSSESVPSYNSSQYNTADSLPQYNAPQDSTADSLLQYDTPQYSTADSLPQYNTPQDNMAESASQYGSHRYDTGQVQPQQEYIPQYTYTQSDPGTAQGLTSPKAEYAVGAIVMSVLGSVFLLTGLVYFAVNYLDTFAQGMVMYAVCALILVVSEFVIRRAVPKLSAVFTAIGISGVFLTTVVNYKSLNNISLGVAAILLALCSALVCLFGYVRKSQLYSIIGFLAAFISSVAIGSGVSPVEFAAITIGTLIISTMWLFFPASKRYDVLSPLMIMAELAYFLATTTFDIVTPDVGAATVSRIIFIAASWLVICLIYFISDIRNREYHADTATSDTINFVVYLVAAFIYGVAIRFLMEMQHFEQGEAILYGVIVYTVIVVPQIIFAFIKKSQKSNAALAYYISVLMTGFIIIGCTDTKYILIPVYVLYSLVARILARKNAERLSFKVVDIVVQSFFAIMAISHSDEVYIGTDVFEACFVGLLLLVGLFGGILINSGFKTAVQIMFVFSGCYVLASVFLPSSLGDTAAMGIILLFTYLINNVGTLKGKGYKVYNYFMLVLEILLLITSSHMDLSGENLMIFCISAIFGLAFVILMMNKEYGIFFAGYYIAIPVYLTLVAILLPIENGFVMSIILMTIAVISVIIGFALSEKAIRIYGLVLSILICVKIAVVDLVSFGSTKSKILMYILVGALALVIGCIYMVLESRENKKTAGTQDNSQ